MPELPGIPTLGGRNSVSVSHVGCRYPGNLAITFSSRAHTSRTLVNANQKPSYILLKNKNKDAKVGNTRDTTDNESYPESQRSS